MIEDAIEEIRDAIPKMSPQQQKIATYICEHPDALGVLSLSDFAAKTGISGPTITRFCRTMGYSGFVEFSRRMQSLKQKAISHASYFHNARIWYEREGESGRLATMLLDKDLDNVRALKENYPAEKVASCVTLMKKCQTIAVIGRMSAYPPAVYFEQLLAKITPKMIPMSGGDVLQAAALSRLDQNSLVFCMAFPRYPRATLELSREAAQKGATIIAITDSQISPLAEISELLFTVDTEIFSYIDLFGPVFALINVLCLEFSLAQAVQSEKNLARYDSVVENVYFKTGRKNARKKL